MQGCQHRAVILAKKRSRSLKWRMFTTSPCTKTSVSLFSMPVSEYSVQAPGLTVFIYTFYKAIIIAASRHPASRTNTILEQMSGHHLQQRVISVKLRWKLRMEPVDSLTLVWGIKQDGPSSSHLRTKIIFSMHRM